MKSGIAVGVIAGSIGNLKTPIGVNCAPRV